MLPANKLQYLVLLIRKSKSEDEFKQDSEDWQKLADEVKKMNLEELNQLDAGIALKTEDCKENCSDFASPISVAITMRKSKLFIAECLKSASEEDGEKLLELMRKSFSYIPFLTLLTDELIKKIEEVKDMPSHVVSTEVQLTLHLMAAKAYEAMGDGAWIE